MLTIQSDNGKQGYKVGGKKYRRPKVVLSQRPLRTVLQRLDSETRPILSSQREDIGAVVLLHFLGGSLYITARSGVKVPETTCARTIVSCHL